MQLALKAGAAKNPHSAQSTSEIVFRADISSSEDLFYFRPAPDWGEFPPNAAIIDWLLIKDDGCWEDGVASPTKQKISKSLKSFVRLSAESPSPM